MHCRECDTDVRALDNEHLLGCSGLTLHEYALRHRIPLELLVAPAQLNRPERLEGYPPPRAPRARSHAVLEGLRLVGRLQVPGPLAVVPGEVRALDLLLWDLSWLRDFGFLYSQDYTYDGDSHRVVARNHLKAPRAHLPSLGAATPDVMDVLAVAVAHAGEWHSGYLFLPLVGSADANAISGRLARLGVQSTTLILGQEEGTLLRTLRTVDTDRLLELLEGRLREMPGVWERLTMPTPVVTVAKEVVFDAAHFITDHPAKCANQHGGRYVLHVKVSNRIDPVSGCVLDYGFLKRVVSERIVARFDHHHLNYAAPELSWRSSTELLCVYIWEQLIEYVPSLVELKLYETPQSWCTYRGPTLAELQATGPSPILRHFVDKALGGSRLRDPLRPLRVLDDAANH